jgi:hypothetical protein
LIEIKTSIGTFVEDTTNCKGFNNPTILAAAKCDIPIASLISSSVYNLAWGDSVWARVTAFNKYGASLESSPEGNGAKILTISAPPTALTETVSMRSATSITFSWTAPTINGGAPVEDYRITAADVLTGVWSELKDRHQGITYTAIGLEAGHTYIF